ncbi:hypothetical protein [Streptomyces pacificus]|nr:hypothetical protein [Streptomyces pacificus]
MSGVGRSPAAKVLDSAGTVIGKLGGHATMPCTSVVITSTRSNTA